MQPERAASVIASWIDTSPVEHRAYRSNLARHNPHDALILAFHSRMLTSPMLVNEAITGECHWPPSITLDELDSRALTALASPPREWAPARIAKLRAARNAVRDMIATRDELARRDFPLPYHRGNTDHE